MCELLGVSSKKNIIMNDFLKVFFSHSIDHRNGWGIAFFDDTPAIIKKEPIKAIDSSILRKRLKNNIRTSRCIAHIRRATIGEENIDNTHPFSRYDDSGRLWVIAHNGTIFNSEVLSPYQYVQVGTTDSDRILLYIVDKMNTYYKENKKPPVPTERFGMVEDVIRNITPGNKVDLMIYDGEFLYVHKNEPGTLHMKETVDCALFSTQALEADGWKEVPQNRLLVYKDGELVYLGQKHNNTYVFDEKKWRLLFLEYSKL